jgi:hypothetical protein
MSFDPVKMTWISSGPDDDMPDFGTSIDASPQKDDGMPSLFLQDYCIEINT